MTDKRPSPAAGDSSDRAQSDADQAVNVGLNKSDRTQADANQQTNSEKLDELLARNPVQPAVPAVAVSPKDNSSDRTKADDEWVGNIERNHADRVQSDADHVITVDRLDRLVEVSAALTQSALDVAESTQREIAVAAASRKRFTKAMYAIAALVILLLTPMLILLISGERARSELQDCVQPTGKCFKDGQARVGKTVMQLEENRVLALVCLEDYPNLPDRKQIVAIDKCIKKYEQNTP